MDNDRVNFERNSHGFFNTWPGKNTRFKYFLTVFIVRLVFSSSGLLGRSASFRKEIIIDESATAGDMKFNGAPARPNKGRSRDLNIVRSARKIENTSCKNTAFDRF